MTSFCVNRWVLSRKSLHCAQLWNYIRWCCWYIATDEWNVYYWKCAFIMFMVEFFLCLSVWWYACFLVWFFLIIRQQFNSAFEEITLASIYEMIFDFGHYYDSVVLYCYKELCTRIYPVLGRRTSWLWSYGSWIYKYLYNQCLSPLTLWVRISLMQCVLDTTLCDKVCQWLTAGRLFSPGTPVSSTNKTDCHDKTEILLKVALNTINHNLIEKRHDTY